MSTRELILTEIARISEEDLDELYEMIKNFTRAKEPKKGSSLMARLKRVQIEAPEDFASNLDLYVSGEKRAGPDLR